jgi:pimeloyl-ACP methyl ester carboxylesterase
MSTPRSTAVERFSHAGATLVSEESGTGRVLFVLVHGIGMGRSVFADLGELLNTHGRVVAVDLPGYGETPEPGRVLSIEENADVVAAYVRDLLTGERDSVQVVILGHSMGAQVAMEAAARHPDVVDRIVLIGPTVDPDARTALRQLWRLTRDITPESPRVIAVGAREYLRAGPRILAKVNAMLAHHSEDTAPRVPVPALVVRGEKDLVVPPAWAQRLTAAMPDARLREVDGHGHETMIRNAAPTAALIAEFLDETNAGTQVPSSPSVT